MRVEGDGFFITHKSKNTSPEAKAFAAAGKTLVSAYDIAFLTRYGYAPRTLRHFMILASENGVEPHEEMIATGQISARQYYRYLADDLNLDFVEEGGLGQIELSTHKGIVHALRHSSRILTRSVKDELILITAPKQKEIERLRQRLSHYPGLARRIAIAEPSTIRQSYLRQLSSSLCRHAAQGLFSHMPAFSAYQVAAYSIVTVVMMAALLTVILTFLPTSILTLAACITITALFFLSVLLRFAAAVTLKNNKNKLQSSASLPQLIKAHELPVYSVLVAAYDEAAVMSGLIDALANLDWPKAKLDIKIILETGDDETIDAAKAAIRGRGFFEVIVVPPGQPRTKPRALNYALTLAKGDFLVIYDAEDRPHPLQLRAAYNRFMSLKQDVACIQAPLLIDNANHTWLSAMFSLEYAGLFDGVIPAFARWRLPVLLGGTSNHFKTRILRGVGAWDPYNVTEDADLGIRLKRFGYRAEAIDLPTYEEAPASFMIWLKQRTRWFKGWMQTCLVSYAPP